MKKSYMSSNAYSHMETLPDVGNRFRQLRKQAGKTQSEVAGAVGMRQEALSRFESGRGSDFSLTKLLRLLQVLDVVLDFVSTTRRPTLLSVLEERRHNANVGPDSRFAFERLAVQESMTQNHCMDPSKRTAMNLLECDCSLISDIR